MSTVKENIIGNRGSADVAPAVAALLQLLESQDPITEFLKVVEQNQERFAAVSESLIDETNKAIATYYLPSSDGFSMYGFDSVGFDIEFEDADGTLTGTFEVANDEDLATGLWPDVTKSGYDGITNLTNYTSFTVTNGNLKAAVDFDNLNRSRMRVKLVVAGSATNKIIIKMRRKVR